MNKMRKTARFFISGLCSVIILSLIMCLYSITPVHMENPNKNTDYIWTPNSVWVKMTEGVSYGKFDYNGFNNKTVIKNPDIIILGSSHMEATEVMQNENTAFLLSQKFNGHHSVYNMGISGHDIYKVCHYLKKSIDIYKKSVKYVVIETSTIDIDSDKLDSAINQNSDFTKSYNHGIIGAMQKIPFIRIAYQQFDGGLKNIIIPELNKDKKNKKNNDVFSAVKPNPESYKKLFSYLSEIQSDYSVKIILMYHPSEEIKQDGSISFEKTKSDNDFKQCAEKYGIEFIDLSDAFEEMYIKEHKLPHGFCTGKLGEGHLNRYGHMCASNELYRTISKGEE